METKKPAEAGLVERWTSIPAPKFRALQSADYLLLGNRAVWVIGERWHADRRSLEHADSDWDRAWFHPPLVLTDSNAGRHSDMAALRLVPTRAGDVPAVSAARVVLRTLGESRDGKDEKKADKQFFHSVSPKCSNRPTNTHVESR